MSDEKSNPSARPGAESPVGDMTEQGETEVGPHPSLTNLENWEESDIESAAGDEAEEQPE